MTEDLDSQALSHALGILSPKESEKFENLLDTDPKAREVHAEVLDALGLVGRTAPLSRLPADLRDRVLQLGCTPTTFTGIDHHLPTSASQQEKETPKRYTGGAISVDLGDLGKSSQRDSMLQIYEEVLGLHAQVTGESPASEGDFTSLTKSLESSSILANGYFGKNVSPLSSLVENPPVDAMERSLCTCFPSVMHFTRKVLAGSAGVADARRLFYLSRDQLKIMRASFDDLDAAKSAEDKSYRLHGAELLRSKWWGATHSFQSEERSVRCGNFFDGPITERCIEFAEYDANLYSLANIMALHSEDGNFDIEILRDKVPGSVVAVVGAQTIPAVHQKIVGILDSLQTQALEPSWEMNAMSIVANSLANAFRLTDARDCVDRRLLGIAREENKTCMWFVWPSVGNQEQGPDASTSTS